MIWIKKNKKIIINKQRLVNQKNKNKKMAKKKYIYIEVFLLKKQ